jgi:hypothetical protein
MDTHANPDPTTPEPVPARDGRDGRDDRDAPSRLRMLTSGGS